MTFDGLRFRSLFYCWGEFLNCSAGVFIVLFKSKIHPNNKIMNQNLSPIKVVTLLCKISMTDKHIYNLKKAYSEIGVCSCPAAFSSNS